MLCSLSSKMIVFALACVFSNPDDISFLRAKNQLIDQFKRYNAEKDLGIKSTDFEISKNGFIRYRKTDQVNKSEYFSVKLNEFKELSYFGNEKAGWFLLKFTEESIIYQTYNDKAGNVDKMLTEIKIPVKDIDVEEINSFSRALDTLKKSEDKP